MAPFPSYTKKWHTSTYPTISPTRPELSLAGKTVLITGGSAGIGLAISKSVVIAGAKKLIILGRRSEVLASAASELYSLVGDKTTVLTFSVDVSKQEQVTSAFTEISEKLNGEKIDILISCAGYFTGPRPIGTETVDEWQMNFDINVKGLYLVVSAFLKVAKPDSTIINISTAITHLDAKIIAPWGMVSYAATKLAGTKIMEFVQGENPEITVVNVHPGQVVETEMAAKSKASSAAEAEGVEREHIDDAELAADFVVWSASKEAAFLKGKLVWVNWDVDELIAGKEEIEGSKILTLSLEGYSSVRY